jgi:hypothetical protein
MVDQSVVDYIKKHKNEHDIGALRKALIEQGHRPEDVDEAVRLAESGSAEKGGGSKKLIAIVIACVVIFIMILVIPPLWAYLTLSSYMGGLLDIGFEIEEAFCTANGTAILVVKNSGESPMDTGDVEILDAESGNTLTPGDDFTWEESTIAEGETGTVRIDCGESNQCRYRLFFSGRTLVSTVQC